MESASDLLDLKDTLVNRTRHETLLLQQSPRQHRAARRPDENAHGAVPAPRAAPASHRAPSQPELGKQVELNVFNADGEMDHSILERMISPLEHMLRNAVDRGIETQEQRQKSGKDALGNINLTISREGGDVLISMQDDGRGINIAAVRKKPLSAA